VTVQPVQLQAPSSWWDLQIQTRYG